MKATIVEGGSYAPCSYLLVAEGADYRDEDQTVLFQVDWDFPGVAGLFGWTPCCDYTDGTVDCEHKTAGEHITEAADILSHHAELGTLVDAGDYL